MNPRHLLLIAVLGLAGCVSNPDKEQQPFQPVSELPPGYGVIYVYRMLTSSRPDDPVPQLYIDGQPVGVLQVDGYLWQVVPAGRRRVEIRSMADGRRRQGMVVEVMAGGSHFLRYTLGSQGVYRQAGVIVSSDPDRLLEVSMSQGLGEASTTQFFTKQ